MTTPDPSVSMDVERGVEHWLANGRRTKNLKLAVLVWRFLAFASTLSAFVVMITNKQGRYLIPGLQVKVWAKYHYSDAFIWFVVANGIAFSYLLLTLLFTPLLKSPIMATILLPMDLIVAFIILSGASAAAAVAYIGKHGLREANWRSICGNFDRYCDHISGALAPSFIGFSFLTLAIIATSVHQRY